jgi:hypothetical protein
VTKEEMADRVAKIKAERDRFVEQANQQIAFLNGQIALLEELLTEEAPAEGAE